MARSIERYKQEDFSQIVVGTALDIILLNGSSFHGKLHKVDNNESITIKISRQKVKFPITNIKEIIVSTKV